MSSEKQIHKKHGLTLVLDRNEVFEDDPGQGTPAMVYVGEEGGDICCTLWCALGEERIEWDRGCRKLSQRQIDWLEEMEVVASRFLYD